MAQSGNASPSSHQLVDFIASFVDARFKESQRAVSGAVIADAVRKEYPDVDLKGEFGDHWLATIATEAEHAGKVLRNRSVKHLELLPPGNSPVAPTSSEASAATRFYVQDDVWKAFVFLPQTKPAFFDKMRNRVVADCSDDESTENRFVEITAIPAETQKEWFHEFVAGNPGLSQSDAPIDDPHWWRSCPNWLRDHNPTLEYQWRGFRADRVTNHIRQWAETNGIAPAAILSPAQQRRGDSKARPRQPIQERTDNRTRDAVLSAIRDMPIEELESLSIPLRYILRHFDAR
ncbi:MAG: hypothetical protein ACYTGL_19940 [Planctomycetota bacterium]|jgi:hypothetical protein